MGDVLKFLVERPLLWLIVGCTGLLVMRLPEPWASELMLRQLRAQHGHWLGGASLLSMVTGIALCLKALADAWAGGALSRQRRQAVLENLNGLSFPEMLYLDFCRQSGQRTLTLSVWDSVAKSLADKGLLEMSRSMGMSHTWTFTMPLFVLEQLRLQPGWVHPESVQYDPRYWEAIQRFASTQGMQLDGPRA